MKRFAEMWINFFSMKDISALGSGDFSLLAYVGVALVGGRCSKRPLITINYHSAFHGIF